MDHSVVVNSSEISTAYSHIKKYVDFLTRQLESYIKILSDIQKNAINDQIIASELSAIANEVKPQIMALDHLINNSIFTTLNREVAEIASADDFSYPNALIAQVSSLLAMFL